MPSEMQNLQMSDSTMSVAEFIGSRPQEGQTACGGVVVSTRPNSR